MSDTEPERGEIAAVVARITLLEAELASCRARACIRGSGLWKCGGGGGGGGALLTVTGTFARGA